MHDLPKPMPPSVGFVNTRCPKCHRITSYLSVQATPLITCTWTNCGYTWCESAEAPFPRAQGIPQGCTRCDCAAGFAMAQTFAH